MSTREAQAQIEMQAQLRARLEQAVARAWLTLPGYDEDDVLRFLSAVLPAVATAQRVAVRITAAFLARSVGGRPTAIDLDQVTGAALRGGIEPQTVYRRPFVTTWTALERGVLFQDAVQQGLARARSTAAMDVQLAMRQTLVHVGERDDRILGYQRVPDAGACTFCRLVSGQRYTTGQLMPIHNHCGCGVDVITAENRGDFTGRAENDLSVTRDGVTASVEDHGELGPLLVNGDQHFTQL